MKIRTDFVTNSSSSSYLFLSVESEEVERLIRKYEIENSKISGKEVSIFTNDNGSFPVETPPSYKGSFSSWLADLLPIFLPVRRKDEKVLLIKEITENAMKIDISVKEYEVSIEVAVTDGDGSFCLSQTMSNGVITTRRITELEWEKVLEENPEDFPDEEENSLGNVMYYGLASVSEYLDVYGTGRTSKGGVDAEKSPVTTSKQAQPLSAPLGVPDYMQLHVQALLIWLEHTFPSRQVTGLDDIHQKLSHEIAIAYPELGYPDRIAFLKAYGYEVAD